MKSDYFYSLIIFFFLSFEGVCKDSYLPNIQENWNPFINTKSNLTQLQMGNDGFPESSSAIDSENYKRLADSGNRSTSATGSASPLFESDEPKTNKIPQDIHGNSSSAAPEPKERTTFTETGRVFLSGRIAAEYRFFQDYGLQEFQDYKHNLSALIEPQLKLSWDHGKGQFNLTPFARIDQHDRKRSHYDIREFLLSQNFSDMTVRLGIGRVFWGVTESRHTVDIINQSDLVENPDGEEKLGQPMLNLEYASKFGAFHLFYLPFSRPRTYPGKFGRIRPPVPVIQNAPEYNGTASTHHPDFAARWSNTFGQLDIGLAHFHGTTREPVWRAKIDRFGQPTGLTPVYDVIDQTSLDLAWAHGSWLWKLEAFTRSGQGPRFEQLTAGLEYTISGLANTGTDLGLLMEYLYDGRQRRNLTTPFEHDLYLGSRLGFNDTQNTELLAGLLVDTTFGTITYSIEASRRIGDSWKLNFEARGFSNIATDDFAYLFRKENYFMLELEKYF